MKTKNINEYSKMKTGNSDAKQSLQRSLNHLYIALMFGVLCYYILPFMCGLYFGGNKDIFVYILLYINTVYSFGACYFHAIKNGVKWYMPVAIGVFFIPSCLAFGYMSISLMALVYMVLGLFGSFSGNVVYRRKMGLSKGFMYWLRNRKKKKGKE